MKSVLLAAATIELSCAEPCRMIAAPPQQIPSELARITEEPKPRCSAQDPACGPEPISAKPVCYRPSVARRRLPPGEARSTRACAHDGECVIAGCGNACVGYQQAQIETNCIGYDWLDEDAFCGCVEGGCSFFRQ